MPLYEYHCPDCAKDMELLVRASDASPDCPDCGSHKLEKQFSIFASSGSSDSGPIGGGGGCCQKGGCGCN